jgi:uncharacterized protein YggT (Ycf19 family)
MRFFLVFVCLLLSLLETRVNASVFLPQTSGSQTQLGRRSFVGRVGTPTGAGSGMRMRMRTGRSSSETALAMAIPGNGVAEQIFVGGFSNFLTAYNFLITGRILLSWFPQAAGVELLQPIYAVTDPFLNIFRGIIPPVFGLDISPLAAFFLLSVVTNATAAVGCEIPPHLKHKKSYFIPKKSIFDSWGTKKKHDNLVCLNY